MDDNDPDFMPEELLCAYAKPVHLLDLLRSEVYTGEDRIVVGDAFLSALIERHGEPWVFAKSRSGRALKREEPLSEHVSSLGRGSVQALSFTAGVPDFGGRAETLPILASIMQPGWARWWDRQRWREEKDVDRWAGASSWVLGPRQLAWIAAQYARLALGSVQPKHRDACRKAIEAAETWARVPWVAHREAAEKAAATAKRLAEESRDAFRPKSYGAEMSAYNAAECASRQGWHGCVVQAAAYSAAVIDSDWDDPYEYLCKMTKHMIEPTLITSPMRS